MIHDIQKSIFEKHKKFTIENTFKADTYEDFKEKVEK